MTRDPISGSSGCAIRQPSTSQDENPAKPCSPGSAATAAARRAAAAGSGGAASSRARRAHQANPRSLVGHGSAQREALAQRLLAFDALEAAVAREVGRGGDVDLLRAERARLRLDRGDDLPETASRRLRQRAARDRRGLDRERDLRWIRLAAQRRERVVASRKASRGPPSRRSSTMPADSPSKSAIPTAASAFHAAIMRAASSPMRGVCTTSATRLVRSIQLLTRYVSATTSTGSRSRGTTSSASDQ